MGPLLIKVKFSKLIQAIKAGDEIIATVAPAFIGQFGPKVTPEVLKKQCKELGFKDVVEVAIGATIYVQLISKGLLRKSTCSATAGGNIMLSFLVNDGQKEFPEFKSYIS